MVSHFLSNSMKIQIMEGTIFQGGEKVRGRTCKNYCIASLLFPQLSSYCPFLLYLEFKFHAIAQALNK